MTPEEKDTAMAHFAEVGSGLSILVATTVVEVSILEFILIKECICVYKYYMLSLLLLLLLLFADCFCDSFCSVFHDNHLLISTFHYYFYFLFYSPIKH